MDIQQIAAGLGEYAKVHDYKGIDPYDMLNSPFAGVLSLGTRIGRIALTQLGRRSPVNFRPLLGVRPGVNPKAAALFLEGNVRLYRETREERFSAETGKLVTLLAQLRSPGHSGSAWGYNFPWQNRFQCLPRYTPTIVNSAFAGHALLDCFEATGNEQALELARSIPEFFLNNLNRLREGDLFCFSYTPLDRNFVHNANMLGASLLARLAVQYQRPELLDPALSALAYSMKYQHEDGSWYYAEPQVQHWIDSFHTGFNLEALRRFLQLKLVPEYRKAFDAGRDFYAAHFWGSDGEPFYYVDRPYVVDVHAPAECLCFFSQEGAEFHSLIDRVARWTLDHLYDEKTNLFYYRKSSHFTIKIPYMRWSLAWAFRGLSAYLENIHARNERVENSKGE